jgi:hypothetical protein
LDSAGLGVIQRESRFSKDVFLAVFHRRCQTAEMATLTGLEPVQRHFAKGGQ